MHRFLHEGFCYDMMKYEYRFSSTEHPAYLTNQIIMVHRSILNRVIPVWDKRESETSGRKVVASDASRSLYPNAYIQNETLFRLDLISMGEIEMALINIRGSSPTSNLIKSEEGSIY